MIVALITVATVKLDRIKASAPTHESPIDLEAVGDFDGLHFEIDGTPGSFFALSDPEEMWPVRLGAKSGLTIITVDGTIRNRLDGSGSTLEHLTPKPPPLQGPFEIPGRVVEWILRSPDQGI